MTGFTDADRQEWLAMRRGGFADDDDDFEVPSDTCSHCGNAFASETGMVTGEFALWAVCDDD